MPGQSRAPPLRALAIASQDPFAVLQLGLARGVAMFAGESGAHDELAAYFREHPNG